MIRAVPGSSIAATTTASGKALRRFAQTLRYRHTFARGCGAGLRWALLLLVPVILVAWLWPAVLEDVLLGCAAILLPTIVIAASRAYWQSRRIFSALKESLFASGEGVATLHDELVTWLEFDAHARGGVAKPSDALAAESHMLRWLEADVQQRLVPHRARALAAVSMPRLGRWRWLLPAVLLLLLIWLLAVWLAPPWSGAIGGLPNQPQAGDGDGPGGGGRGGGAGTNGEDPDPARNEDAQPDPGQQAEQQPSKQPPPPTGPEPSPPDPQQPDDQSDPREVPPMIELPPDQRFVVPDFIGDGPTRRARMHAAELDEQAAGQARQDAASGSQAANPDAPKPPQPDFERAAEAAQRARHVPAAERAMVRRFFDKLREQGNK